MDQLVNGSWEGYPKMATMSNKPQIAARRSLISRTDYCLPLRKVFLRPVIARLRVSRGQNPLGISLVTYTVSIVGRRRDLLVRNV